MMCLNFAAANGQQTSGTQTGQGQGRRLRNHLHLKVVNRHLFASDRSAPGKLPAIDLELDLPRLVQRVEIASVSSCEGAKIHGKLLKTCSNAH